MRLRALASNHRRTAVLRAHFHNRKYFRTLLTTTHLPTRAVSSAPSLPRVIFPSGTYFQGAAATILPVESRSKPRAAAYRGVPCDPRFPLLATPEAAGKAFSA